MKVLQEAESRQKTIRGQAEQVRKEAEGLMSKEEIDNMMVFSELLHQGYILECMIS